MAMSFFWYTKKIKDARGRMVQVNLICNEQKRFLREIYYWKLQKSSIKPAGKDEAPHFAVTSYSSSHSPTKSTGLARQRCALFSSEGSTLAAGRARGRLGAGTEVAAG